MKKYIDWLYDNTSIKKAKFEAFFTLVYWLFLVIIIKLGTEDKENFYALIPLFAIMLHQFLRFRAETKKKLH